jgi:hypothetical protein
MVCMHLGSPGREIQVRGEGKKWAVLKIFRR